MLGARPYSEVELLSVAQRNTAGPLSATGTSTLVDGFAEHDTLRVHFIGAGTASGNGGAMMWVEDTLDGTNFAAIAQCPYVIHVTHVPIVYAVNVTTAFADRLRVRWEVSTNDGNPVAITFGVWVVGQGPGV